MDLADDKDINIYYHDTDSMHIDEHKVNELAKHYEEKCAAWDLVPVAFGIVTIIVYTKLVLNNKME